MKNLINNITVLLRLLVSTKLELTDTRLVIDINKDIWFKSNTIIKQIDRELVLTDKSSITDIVISWILCSPEYRFTLIPSIIDRKDFAELIRENIPDLLWYYSIEDIEQWKQSILQEYETNTDSRKLSKEIV
jgi:hypothetical protein